MLNLERDSLITPTTAAERGIFGQQGPAAQKMDHGQGLAPSSSGASGVNRQLQREAYLSAEGQPFQVGSGVFEKAPSRESNQFSRP